MTTKYYKRTPTQIDSKRSLMMRRRTRFQQTEKFVCRLQNCMPMKHSEMVKSHLSSALEMPSAELESILTCRPETVKRQRTSSVSFGKKKTQKNSVSGHGLSPKSLASVLTLINYLSKDDIIAAEGLFRKTGNICRQKKLKVKLEAATITQQDMEVLSPHDCANVLKNYIHNLTEPLMTQNMLDVYVRISDIRKSSKEDTVAAKLLAIQLSLQLLPADNINLLKPLMTLLNKAAFVSNNLMTPYSLGILFAPQLFCSKKSSAEKIQALLPKLSELVTFMIEKSSQIFYTPKELSQSAANFFREMEVPNQLYYSNVQERTDSSVKSISPQVHVVDMIEAKSVLTSEDQAHQTTPVSKVSRKRLNSDTCDGIPEKRPSPEMFLSPDCSLFGKKPKLSNQTNSIIFHTRPISFTEKPVARVKPIQHSPISRFLKRVPMKLQRAMSTPRSREPMAMLESPACNLKF